MATYQELFDLSTERDVVNKVAVACVVKAEALINGGTPAAAEIVWANNTLADPVIRAKTLVNYVLAANRGLTKDAIRTATDAAVQTNVDASVDKMIAGGIA